jgi:hypothetical protein
MVRSAGQLDSRLRFRLRERISLLSKNGGVRADIRRRGFGFVSGSQFHLSYDTRESWQALRSDWHHLPADAYLKDQGRYRFRRYDRFFFLPISGELLPLPHRPFLQRKGFNQLHGDIEREFARLPARSLENVFLRELVKFDFGQFSPRNDLIEKPWEVGIHEIRIVAKPGEAGKPTPEGRHRDGYNFIAMHLIRRRNIVGGVTTLYGNGNKILQALTLLDPLDSLYVEDTRVTHDVTPVHSENQTRGIRDVLVVTYRCAPSMRDIFARHGRGKSLGSAAQRDDNDAT